ncbi:MAG TPA: GNAT family N-acetyltransferase [Roseiflexaceae bacterium]|nr:GNAT family N-acetyltransferase [Roseiflexaceae bacterium]
MMADPVLPFPLGHGSVVVTTRDRRDVTIRHIAPKDAALLVDLYKRLSRETLRLRFLSPQPERPDEIVWAEAMRQANINPLVEAALIGVVSEDSLEYAVGVAQLAREGVHATTAEVAIVLRDDYQGMGLGTQLFDLLLQVALVRGLKSLRAYTLAENTAMRQLVRRSGLPFTQATSYGETTITIALADDSPVAG